MKFKVGDKVRIIAANHGQNRSLVGDIYTVVTADKEDCSYFLTDRYKFIWAEDELELVVPKIGDRVKVIGTNFVFKKKYVGCIYEVINILPPLNDGRGPRYVVRGANLIFYENELEIIYGGQYLKNGDYVKLRDGSIGIALVDIGAITFGRQYMCLNDVRDDLTNRYNENCDVMSVRRPTRPNDCVCDIFDSKRGELVYERKEVEEMTLEEVCKALGKEIKIVKEK